MRVDEYCTNFRFLLSRSVIDFALVVHARIDCPGPGIGPAVNIQVISSETESATLKE